MSNAIKQAYELGWRRSAEWSKRDDLVSDIDSPAYKRDRDEDLAHLSAQAKVRVSDADFECIKDTIRNHHLTYSRDDEGDGYPLIDALSVGHQTVKEGLEEVDLLADAIASALDDSFAARLSQGAQGEAIGEIRWMGNVPGSGMTEVLWKDGQEPPVGTKLYTHPAERAAVPDGWTLRRTPAQFLENVANGWFLGDHPEIKAVHDHLILLSSMLAAAPQPPEGARVVAAGWQPIETAPKDKTPILVINGNADGYGTDAFQMGIARWEIGGFSREHWYSTVCCDHVSYFIPTHWMPLPAAPTLAGKDGA